MFGRRQHRTLQVLPDPCGWPKHTGCRWCGHPSSADVAAAEGYRARAAQRKAINDAAAAAVAAGTFPYPLGSHSRTVTL